METEMITYIVNLISTVGFPIVCVLFMWRKITDSDEKQTALLTELTIAIKNLTEYIKGGEHRERKKSPQYLKALTRTVSLV